VGEKAEVVEKEPQKFGFAFDSSSHKQQVPDNYNKNTKDHKRMPLHLLLFL